MQKWPSNLLSDIVCVPCGIPFMEAAYTCPLYFTRTGLLFQLQCPYMDFITDVSDDVSGSASIWLEPLHLFTVNTFPVLISFTLKVAPFGIFLVPPLNQSSFSVFNSSFLLSDPEDEEEPESAFLAFELFSFSSVFLPTTPSFVRPLFF